MEIKLNISPLSSWLTTDVSPLVFAGPCSAETEEQVLAIAHQLKTIPNVKVFRAGIWKPRTRPNAFEGVGTIGLKWLQRVKEETGLLVTTEVANAQHTEEALKHGIDILWIGARTSANPFSVQEIADVLKGTDIPVMVKNPVNPDLQLWIGALERINQAGITKLAAIHRGFSTYKTTIYRNSPNWKIPIELKRLLPNLPIICDPSHIAGDRDLLLPIIQKAFDLEMNGTMIETHISPDEAWSDAKQQITPNKLKEFLSKIIVRQQTSTNKEFTNKLEKLRSKIDEIDNELMNILSKRMKIVEEIGQYKKENHITILQRDRWDDILQERKQLAEKLQLKQKFVDEIFTDIHKESIRIQTEIMNDNIKPIED